MITREYEVTHILPCPHGHVLELRDPDAGRSVWWLCPVTSTELQDIATGDRVQINITPSSANVQNGLLPLYLLPAIAERVKNNDLSVDAALEIAFAIGQQSRAECA